MCLQNYEKYGKQQPLHTVKMQSRPTPTPQAARRPRSGRQPSPPAMAGGMCRLWPHRCHTGAPAAIHHALWQHPA